jgi:hypothetical protein
MQEHVTPVAPTATTTPTTTATATVAAEPSAAPSAAPPASASAVPATKATAKRPGQPRLPTPGASGKSSGGTVPDDLSSNPYR